MNPERAFEDLGIDAVTGVSVMEMLGVSTDELSIPQRFSRLKEVINYFKQFPEDTQRFLIRKATAGKLVDKLDHLYEYTHLLQRKSHYEETLKGLDKERSAIETTGDEVLLRDVAQRSLDNSQQLDFIKQEIGIYEK